MRVLLIDVDSKMPNLALMKISSYHKAQGDEVDFDTIIPEKVYISTVFTKSRAKVERLLNQYPRAFVGGPGWDIHSKLPDEIERLRPDLKLYNIDYVIGRTTKGCFRRCPWCIEWRICPEVRAWEPIEHIMLSSWNCKKVVLLDANLLGEQNHLDTLMTLTSIDVKVNFNQGLDIRLVNADVAFLLSEIKSYDRKFNKKRYYFAFDKRDDEKEVIRGLKFLLKKIPASQIMFYILAGFPDPDNYDDVKYRASVVEEYGCDAYIMCYWGTSRRIRVMAAFVNKRKCKAKEYRPL